MRIPSPADNFPSSSPPSAEQPIRVVESEAYVRPTEVKIVLTGDSSVGKTCLMLRFCNEEQWDETTSTCGVDFRVRRLRVKGEEVKLVVWVGREVLLCTTYGLSDARTRQEQSASELFPLSTIARLGASSSV